jgi:hypothetical protein
MCVNQKILPTNFIVNSLNINFGRTDRSIKVKTDQTDVPNFIFSIICIINDVIQTDLFHMELLCTNIIHKTLGKDTTLVTKA